MIIMFCCGWVSAQSYHIGDLYTAPDGSQGIVYYIHPDGSGWVVALNDASMGCAWGNATDVPNLTNQNPVYYQPLLTDTAGYTNTQIIRTYQNSNSIYAAGVVDFAHGWVLPSPAQLSMLYGQLPFVSTALTRAGGTDLARDFYWCSGERDANNAWRVHFALGYFNYTNKTTSCRVRAVRSFSATTVVYDTTLTYLWNTGSTQPHIDVSPGQTTTYTVTATTEFGCSNTAEQTILVGNNAPQVLYDTVCQGAGYEANGVTLTPAETGTAGTLTLSREMTVGNCSSTITLQLTVTPTATVQIEAAACETYEWNGVTYDESGDYTQTFTSSGGCDSVVTLHLTVNHGTHNVTDTTVCESFTWTDGTGETYTVSGTYTFDYTNGDGCASTDTLHLTVNYGTHNVTDTTVCESYTWTDGTGETYTVSGTYVFDYTNTEGCESADTLYLTVHYGTHNVTDTTVCESFTWTEGTGDTYTESGTYTFDYTNGDGCASTDTLHLTVNHSTHNVTDTTVCESFTWTEGTGETYTESGTYTFDYTNGDGCESADTLRLLVNHGTHNVTDTTVCESYTWTDGTGETYTVSGTYIFDYSISDDCPNTDTLYLTVNHAVSERVETTVCKDDFPFEWNGLTFTEDATQSVVLQSSNGCDSIVTMVLNSIDDDFRIVMLTEDPCADFSAELLAQTGMTNFIWSTGETTPQITVTHSETYYVTASEGNCIVTDNIFVPVCDFQLYLPNAITASDNNGINDYFFIPQYSQRQISDFEIVIYNRWGQMVFRSEDKNFRWHGDSNGKIMANTTYTYVIHCTNYNGQKFIFKGIVTVL